VVGQGQGEAAAIWEAGGACGVHLGGSSAAGLGRVGLGLLENFPFFLVHVDNFQ
jgi:hypothetical protein